MKKITSEKKELSGTVQFRRFCVHIALYVTLSVIGIELVFRGAVYKSIGGDGLLYALLFDTVYIIAVLLASSFSTNIRTNRIVAASLLTAMGLYCSVQLVSKTCTGSLFALSDSGARTAMEFADVGFASAARLVGLILIVLLPGAALFLLKRCVYTPRCPWGLKAAFVIAAAVVQIGATCLVNGDTAGKRSVSYIYSCGFDAKSSARLFGVLTSLRLDVAYLAQGMPAPPEAAEPVYCDGSPELSDGEGYNIIIDDDTYAQIIANETNTTVLDMHRYFSSLAPTSKNIYTGWFEGKNLIMIVAEGFSDYVIDEQRTPTLYKLANEGFRFTNYYTPLWPYKTADCEYAALTGLVPAPGIRSMRNSYKNDMAFCLGNQFKSLGYAALAYHNYYYTFNGRNYSHPNLGYKFIAYKNGLDITYMWPPSDYEMAVKTYDKYSGISPFHIYYLTMSGHKNYTWGGNAMVRRNWSTVANLPYSTRVKAYIACNYELEKAVAYLYERLEQDGLLEDTVIAITPDHYPYGGLTTAEISELAGENLDYFGIAHSALIIWNPCIETPIVIDKPCSTLDFNPTLSNLFGLEYDSRLMAGADILSDSPGLVPFSNRSFIAEKGRYDADTGIFTPNEGETVEDGYVEAVKKIVDEKFYYSAKILAYDYYARVLK